MWKNIVFSFGIFKKGLQVYTGKWKKAFWANCIGWGKSCYNTTPNDSLAWSYRRIKSSSVYCRGQRDLSYWTLTHRLFALIVVEAYRCYSSRCSRCTRHFSRSDVSGRSSIVNLREGISHSIERIDSMPCTNWKGEKLVEVFTKVRYAQSVG